MIKAMKQALEALEKSLPRLAPYGEQDWLDSKAAITSLRQAIAELESQEPVAWGVDWSKAGDIPCASIIKRLPNGGIEVMAVEYAPHPPQRTWVGLTDTDLEQIKLLTFEKEINAEGEEQEAVNLDQLIRAAEQLCKEKNRG